MGLLQRPLPLLRLRSGCSVATKIMVLDGCDHARVSNGIKEPCVSQLGTGIMRALDMESLVHGRGIGAGREIMDRRTLG